MDCTNDAYTVQPDFIKACKLANTEPTRRQASRFRMGKGRAYNVSRIIPSAPPVPSWFQPVMRESCPAVFTYLPEVPKEGEDDQDMEARICRDYEGEKEVQKRNAEISEWKTRERVQAAEQWPKVWAFKALGL